MISAVAYYKLLDNSMKRNAEKLPVKASTINKHNAFNFVNNSSLDNNCTCIQNDSKSIKHSTFLPENITPAFLKNSINPAKKIKLHGESNLSVKDKHKLASSNKPNDMIVNNSFNNESTGAKKKKKKKKKQKNNISRDVSSNETSLLPRNFALRTEGDAKNMKVKKSNSQKMELKKSLVNNVSILDASESGDLEVVVEDINFGDTDEHKQLSCNHKHGDEDLDGLEFDMDEDDEFVIVPPINPLEHAQKMLCTLLEPITLEVFIRDYWCKKPLHVSRDDESHYEDWFSTDDLDNMLTLQRIMYTEHLDVTSYENNIRKTHNPEGRAFRPMIWDFYNCGYSIRLLCPQVFHPELRVKLNVLQEYFGCFVGANVYLTPPGTQGFAPHYDDIDAMVLQLEGKKRWKLYNPRSSKEEMPLTSSGNFTQEEIGKVMMEVTLEPGDFLYIPRGVIHQAESLPDDYSLHITLSTNQRNSWGDLLLRMLPLCVQKAIENDVQYRTALPMHVLKCCGTALSMINGNTKKNKNGKDELTMKMKRESILVRQEAARLAHLLVDKYFCLDEACDEMAKSLVHDSLPPSLHPSESGCHISEQGEMWSKRSKLFSGSSGVASGHVVNKVELTPDTKIRLVRWTTLRLVLSHDNDVTTNTARLYHSVNNTNVYHEVEAQYCEVVPQAVPFIQTLLVKYPEFVDIESFPGELNVKMDTAYNLYEMGLVITSEMLEPCEDEDDSCEDEDDSCEDDES